MQDGQVGQEQVDQQHRVAEQLLLHWPPLVLQEYHFPAKKSSAWFYRRRRVDAEEGDLMRSLK